MERLKILFFSLSDRDRRSLIVLFYAVVIIGGFFLLLPASYNFSEKNHKILNEKVKEFYLFKELLSKYNKTAPVKKAITLATISNIAKKAGFNLYIVSLKPTADGFEVNFENADTQSFTEFLKRLKKNGISVNSIRINGITGKLKGFLILSGEAK